MILKTKLYSHQKQAVEKLNSLKVGALYMEMGTGKTRTALELIAKRMKENKIDRAIWLCPFSVKETIRKEFDKHINIGREKIEIYGIETLSSSTKTNIELLNKVKNNKVFLVVDESSLIKNPGANRTKSITRLGEYCQYKLILNGTPVSRDESDLFAQWRFLDWRIFGYRSFWSFAHHHVEYDDKIAGRIKDVYNVEYLTKKMIPYTYQIQKDECIQLPRKTFDTYYFKLTPSQIQHYAEVSERLLLDVNEMEPETLYKLFHGLESITSGFKVTEKKRRIIRETFFGDPKENPRIQSLLEVLDDINSKTVIYCKYKQELEDIISVLDNAVTFHGEMKEKERNKSLEKFENEANYLVATKSSAGYGLNLQHASYIIYYNNDWNYGTRAQSEDRVHRIGQTKNVHIIDICAYKTLDERILNCLGNKENLVDSFKSEIEHKKDDISLLEWVNCKKEGDYETLQRTERA